MSHGEAIFISWSGDVPSRHGGDAVEGSGVTSSMATVTVAVESAPDERTDAVEGGLDERIDAVGSGLDERIDAVESGQRHSVCRDASETLECLPPCPGTMSYGGSLGSQRYSVRHESSETREGLPPCDFECHGLGLGVGCGTHGWCASVECHGLGMGIASVLQSEECAHGEAQRHECAAEAPV